MARTEPPPAECAQCGADIPPRAHACPGCGADERTGWREQSIYDGLDLPEADDDSVAPSRRPSGQLPWYWVVASVAVLLLLILAALGLR